MRQMTKKNKIAAVAASAALVAVSGGAAYAYWSTTGAGSGSAAASTGMQDVSITATFAAGLAPGGSEDISYSVTNPNSSSTTVGGLVATVTTDKPSCDVNWITATVPTGTISVAANSTVSLGKGTIAFADNDTNQDACKGAVIKVSVTSK